MSSDWPESRVPGNPIKPCSICGTPPAASVQVGGGTTVFWFECKTCGRKTGIRGSFEDTRQEWNALQ
jgi:hypothetical protein